MQTQTGASEVVVADAFVEERGIVLPDVGMFCISVVQAVLFYGSEMWVVPPQRVSKR